ncbi:MAG TPA: molecular chaperone Skp [Firmicutes bacterium]|nr:molecular chaperone Skp [Bacillota bacterium]
MVPAEKVYAAQAAVSTGVVSYGQLLNQHPDTQKANEVMKNETEQTQKEFAEKSAGMGDNDKQALQLQLSQRLEQKRLELLKPILVKINAAIKAVAGEKGLTLVLDKSAELLGGQDITDDVLKKISEK